MYGEEGQVQSPAGAIGELSLRRSRERLRRLTLRLLQVLQLSLLKARGGQQKTKRGDIALLLDNVKFDHQVRACVNSLHMGCR